MITSLKLIRNVGSFDSYQEGQNTGFKPLTLIYAENGRGKTTLATIFRSLATAESHWIEGRCRLGSQHRPHVVVESASPQQTYVYQNGQWTLSYPALMVFDDQFVDDNVYSGLSVGAGHRQNLHEVILGKQGVTLARQVDKLADEIAELNRSLRKKEADIPKEDLHRLDVDTFCDLPLVENIDKRVDEQSKQVDALRRADAVKKTRFFSRLEFPSFDVDAIDKLLAKQLKDLDNEAISRVRSQFETLGSDGESWAAQGTSYLASQPQDKPGKCPYCGQDVQGVELVDAYRAYFGESYRSHLANIREAIAQHTEAFGGDALATMQQSIGQLDKRHTFWKVLVEVPEVQIDASDISTAWTEARDAVASALKAKQAAPLERTSLDGSAKTKIARYETVREQAAAHSELLVACNDAITQLKQATASGDIQLATDELDRLRATKARHSDQNKPKCQAYLKAKADKAHAERRKQEAREALDTYRRQVFPQYCTSINEYLKKFGASFTIEGVKPQDTAGRPSTAYYLHILNQKVPLQPKASHEPGFHNTLSSGDRNTLALAFFFASLSTGTGLKDAVIVIDDPISSFDDGRSMTTMQEVHRLTKSAKQVVVLSHVKSLLCRLHKHSKPENVASLHLRRVGDCESTLEPWEPIEDQFTEYDHYHKILREFKAGTAPDIRQVAKTLRPVMEGYLRVAYPEHCPPGTLLGPFRERVQQLIDAGQTIMSTKRLMELDEIREYANRFHHETKSAWEPEIPSDAELLGFVNRVLDFIAD